MSTSLVKGQYISPSIVAGGPYRVNTLLKYSSGKNHGALDLGTPTGTKLYAPFDGTVTACVDGVKNNSSGEAIWSGKPSNWILLKCKIKTNYGTYQDATIFFQHLSPGLKVKKGSTVKAGQWIGNTGNSGNSTGPHLHVGAQWVVGGNAGASTRYDHISNAARRVWGPERYIYFTKEATVASAFKSRYSGKPSGKLLLAKSDTYYKMDATVAGPASGGKREDRLVYWNLTPTWRITDKTRADYYRQVCVFRTRFVRSNGDATAYHDYTITPHTTTFLITLSHFEVGETGVGGGWQGRFLGDAVSVTAGTRYGKGSQER